MEARCLYDIEPGQKAVIDRLLTEGPMRRRLMDLGLAPGTKVECLGRSPFGDPAAYRIRGAVIALRRKDCLGIRICSPDPESGEASTAPKGGDDLGSDS